MADGRRKPTDSDIIADEKLLAMVKAASDLPKGSRHFTAAVIQGLRQDGSEFAVDVSDCGDPGLFLLH